MSVWVKWHLGFTPTHSKRFFKKRKKNTLSVETDEGSGTGSRSHWLLLRTKPCYPMCVYVLHHIWLFVTPWTTARQAPLAMRFPRKEYWSRLPYSLLQGFFQAQGLNPRLLCWQVDSLLLTHQGSPTLLRTNHKATWYRLGFSLPGPQNWPPADWEIETATGRAMKQYFALWVLFKFLMWTIITVCIEFVTILFLFYALVFVAMRHVGS